MHIREVNEQLDYQYFMFKGLENLEGNEFRKALGNRTWQLLHGLAENYGCPVCRKNFKMLMTGIHDVVNLFLGKKVYDSDNWVNFMRHVNEANRKYEAQKAIKHGIHHSIEVINH